MSSNWSVFVWPPFSEKRFIKELVKLFKINLTNLSICNIPDDFDQFKDSWWFLNKKIVLLKMNLKYFLEIDQPPEDGGTYLVPTIFQYRRKFFLYYKLYGFIRKVFLIWRSMKNSTLQTKDIFLNLCSAEGPSGIRYEISTLFSSRHFPVGFWTCFFSR
jgi:hypothetical protein